MIKIKNILNMGVMASLSLSVLVSCATQEEVPTTMREAFKDKFLIGAALGVKTVDNPDEKVQKVINEQFSAVVPENCMKAEVVQPEEGKFVFDDADRLIALAEKNNQVLTGHCLVWHSQAPQWFFNDSLGNQVDRETMIERMKNHIFAVAGHMKGKVKGWDVVNEAIEDDGTLRNSPFLQIIGPDFIKIAFQFAHEADPDAELYYNDYSMDKPAKRDAVVRLVRELKEAGCRIDGVGMQSHVAFDTPLDEYEKSIEAFAAEGMKVMVTELDLSVLPWPEGDFGAAVETDFEYMKKMDPYTEGLPEEKAKEQSDFFVKLFKIYLDHSDVIDRVTFWGFSDGQSWKNDWPIKGRTDYPLAVDRNNDPKPFVNEIIKLAKEY